MGLSAKQRAEIALLKIIEGDESTIRQKLEATKQLIAIKKVKIIPRAKRTDKKVLNPTMSILGTG
jgi:hypothetical protein